jgi:hypothetical protein
MFRTGILATACVASALGLLVPCAARAQSGEPVSGRQPANRYVMEKTPDGIVRLDTATGEMTLCREDQGRIVCKMASDERHAIQQSLDRLEARVSKLETALSEMKGESTRIPSDKQLDHAMAAFDRLMRHFFKMAEDFGKDMREQPKTGGSAAPAPQKI